MAALGGGGGGRGRKEAETPHSGSELAFLLVILIGSADQADIFFPFSPTFVAKCFLNSQILLVVLRIVRTIDDIGNWSQYTYYIIRSSRTTRSFLNISNFLGDPAKKAEIKYLEAQLSTLRAIAKPRKKASISTTEPPIADLRPIDGFFCYICVTGVRLQNAIYKRVASPSYSTPRPRSGVFQFTPCPFPIPLPSPQTAH